MSGKKLTIAVMIMALSVLGGTAAQADPFQNGSFETFTGAHDVDIVTLPTGSTAIDHWVILGASGVSNSVELINGGTPFLWQAAEGNWSLDLNGNNVGGIQTTFDTVPGVNYKVEFAMSGNFFVGDSKQMSVTATGTAPQTFTYYKNYEPDWSFNNMNWEEMLYTFAATGNQTTLTFQSLETSYTNFGPVLDNVEVSEVPLPPAILLLGSGLIGLGAWGTRKKIWRS